MDKKKRFKSILEGIKKIKIQGARNIACAALRAYTLFPTRKSKRLLKNLRPTEPMLQNVLKFTKIKSYREILKHIEESQKKINNNVFKIIKNGDVVFTHCHSTTVVNALIYSKKKGKIFEVYNTETRPLFQGRKTARELASAGIKVTMFVDSAIDVALENKQGTKKVNKILLGADALLKKGIINKIGSGVIAKIAMQEKIPFYIAADSWKFADYKIPIEQRTLDEIWRHAPKKIKIKNPAFELVGKKYISKIISELGILRYNQFLKKLRDSS